MTYPYRLVVFDWEGTIADPLGALVNFLWTEVNQHGWAAFTQTQVRHYLLEGLPHAVKSLFVGLSEQQMHALIERAERTVSQDRNKVFLFPGIKALLHHLKMLNISIAIASNKSQQSLNQAIDLSEIGPYVATFKGAGILPLKPNPQMLIEILDFLQISAQDTVMIGDSFADIEMARNVNVDAIAVDWYGSGIWNSNKMGAKAVVNSIEQLAALLGVQLSSGERIEQGV